MGDPLPQRGFVSPPGKCLKICFKNLVSWCDKCDKCHKVGLCCCAHGTKNWCCITILSCEKDTYERETRKFTTKSRKQPIAIRPNQSYNTTTLHYPVSKQNEWNDKGSAPPPHLPPTVSVKNTIKANNAGKQNKKAGLYLHCIIVSLLQQSLTSWLKLWPVKCKVQSSEKRTTINKQLHRTLV